MKIKLGLFIGGNYVLQDLHEDFAGVTAYERERSGEFRVKKINTVSFNIDGNLTVFAEPLDRDVPVKELVVEAPEVSESFDPALLEF